MQDHSTPDQWFVLDAAATQVTVPANIVDWLRRAAYAEIGSAAEALDTAAFADDREAHPEWFRGPAVSLRESYALLDTIGWSRTVPPLAVQIDLHQNGWALMKALAGAVEFADEDLSEMTREKGACADHGLVSECERAWVLDEFTGTVEARIDALAVQEGTEAVLDIAA
jgi:hypothetical protein